MNLDDALQTFIVESRELLENMESALLNIQHGTDSAEAINAIFRAAHTIKGSAGLFGLDSIVTFTHIVESVLDRVREGEVRMDEALVPLLLAAGDHIGTLVTAAEVEEDEEVHARSLPLVAQLQGYLDDRHALSDTPAVLAVLATSSMAATESEHGFARVRDWHISLRFGTEVLRNGMDPLSIIHYLNKLGRITGIAMLPDAVPALHDLDPESCYLGFEIAFASDAEQAAIEGVFEFVNDDCAVHILPPDCRLADYIELICELPEDDSRVAELLVRCGTLAADELDIGALASTATVFPAAAPSIAMEQDELAAADVPLLSDTPVVLPTAPGSVPLSSRSVREHKAQGEGSIRIDADKLDHLIDLVGELITASASANLVARRTLNVEFQECTATLSSLIQEVRDSALQLRMVKIGATFNRFRRVVHDVSREIGKQIELVVDGEDTELDKTVVEKIGDPLTHLVRNSVDHGIEPPEVRAACGKPMRGTVALNAFHDSGAIVIEVSDDGGGLSRERIVAKAVERGLIEEGRSLADEEVYGLIFEPGFSTAEKITNLSGRGVGMDVVKRNITALRGSIGITSRPGLGTTVSVRLPLTLAIIDGFQVGVGQSVFVLPLDMVDECVEFSASGEHDYTNLRGEVLPFIRLRTLFGVSGDPGPRSSIVIVRHSGQRFGLVVDRLLGEAQTVIKPLSKMFGNVRGIGGSTILGCGDVALILDIPALMQLASQPDPAAVGVPQPADTGSGPVDGGARITATTLAFNGAAPSDESRLTSY